MSRGIKGSITKGNIFLFIMYDIFLMHNSIIGIGLLTDKVLITPELKLRIIVRVKNKKIDRRR